MAPKARNMPPQSPTFAKDDIWLSHFEPDSPPSYDTGGKTAVVLNAKHTAKPKALARIGRPPAHPSVVATAFKVGRARHPEWLVVHLEDNPLPPRTFSAVLQQAPVARPETGRPGTPFPSNDALIKISALLCAMDI